MRRSPPPRPGTPVSPAVAPSAAPRPATRLPSAPSLKGIVTGKRAIFAAAIAATIWGISKCSSGSPDLITQDQDDPAVVKQKEKENAVQSFEGVVVVQRNSDGTYRCTVDGMPAALTTFMPKGSYTESQVTYSINNHTYTSLVRFKPLDNAPQNSRLHFNITQ